LVQEGLPGIDLDPLKYALSSTDRHPNALANRMLAAYVLGKITPQK
jgi:hypothetical protein